MRKFVKLIYLCFGFVAVNTYAQSSCPSATDISVNQYVCGYYGDANGNSNWNWEIRPGDPSGKYCDHWYARINNATNLTSMGSPFVNPQTTALELIVQADDFKKAKGWELLRRNFGCLSDVAYPYFILYNKYTGLMRVFIYQPAPPTPSYSSFMVELTPVKSAYPATTSLGDAILTAPDKYQTSTSTSSFGRKIISVTDDKAGSSNWRVAEFNLGFDPNIQDGNYIGSGINLVMYGLVTSTVKAKIRGGSVSGTDPNIYGFSYSPDNPIPTPKDGNFDFKTQGEKFTKFSKTIDDVGGDINKAAKSIISSLSNVTDEKSFKGRIKSLAEGLDKATQSAGSLTKLLNQVGAISGIAGSALSVIGGVVGLFGGDDPANKQMPMYTSYDLTLDGTITAKTVGQSIILRLPGAQQPGPDNLPYYKCPVGIFNIKNTPQAEKITYTRAYAYRDWYPNGPTGMSLRLTQEANFVSYKMSNDVHVSFNSGVGLDLVSAQAAIVGEVQKGSDGNAAYDLLMDHSTDPWPPISDYRNFHTYNFMLPDFQAGILQMTTFESAHNLHTFQTPYVNIECLNGLAFNARAETNVYLRVKAILKKKNDPTNTPIYYIRDYAIDATEVEIDGILSNNLKRWNSYEFPTPFSNYSELPTYVLTDRLINNNQYTGNSVEQADNVISAGDNVYVYPNADVIFKAGYEIELYPGFEAATESNFEAILKINQSNITCSSYENREYNYGQNCYNTNVYALREQTKPNNTVSEKVNAELLKVYPIPTNGKLFIEGVKANSKTTIIILDQSGRSVKELRSSSFDGGRIDVDVSSLSNGVYFVKIQTLEQIITRKIVVTK
jgi:hypothetical protein